MKHQQPMTGKEDVAVSSRRRPPNPRTAKAPDECWAMKTSRDDGDKGRGVYSPRARGRGRAGPIRNARAGAGDGARGGAASCDFSAACPGLAAGRGYHTLQVPPPLDSPAAVEYISNGSRPHRGSIDHAPGALHKL